MSNQMKDYQTEDKTNRKSKECILIKPNRELTFIQEKNKFIADMSLTNKKDGPALFKVRTTAARSYAVFPTIGLIPPQQTRSVKIIMPAKEQIDDRLQDKFLVQAFIYEGEDLEDDARVLNQVFDSHYKALSSKEFQNSKLRVHFERHSVIEEEPSEDGTPIKELSPSTAETRVEDLTDSSAFQKSKPMSCPNSSLKQMPKQTSAMTSAAEVPVKTEENEASGDAYAQVTKNEKYIDFNDPIVPESQKNTIYKVHTDEKIVRERDTRKVPSSLPMLESSKVVRNLVDEFEKGPIVSSLTHLPTSFQKKRDSINANDVSIYSGVSDIRSSMSAAEQLEMYKSKVQLLEQKFNHQQALLADLNKDKEAFLNEVQNLKDTSFSSEVNEAKSEENNKPQYDLWQLMVISIICLVFGALFK